MNENKPLPAAARYNAPCPELTEDQWHALGALRFGPDPMKWRFTCPSCGHVASVQDWKDAGATEGEVAFSCIGRHLNADDKNTFRGKGGPCQYAGGGLFAINPQRITGRSATYFAFSQGEPDGTPPQANPEISESRIQEGKQDA